MPWTATFDDGPAAGGSDRVFAVGEPWRQIILAPLARRPDPWVIVGGDGIDDHPPDPPWAAQVTYRLQSVDDGDEPTAHYLEIE
jgi:hypothetical protein